MPVAGFPRAQGLLKIATALSELIWIRYGNNMRKFGVLSHGVVFSSIRLFIVASTICLCRRRNRQAIAIETIKALADSDGQDFEVIVVRQFRYPTRWRTSEHTLKGHSFRLISALPRPSAFQVRQLGACRRTGLRAMDYGDGGRILASTTRDRAIRKIRRFLTGM